jgi:predicted ester cyclase
VTNPETTAQRDRETVRRLLEDAMPNGRFDELDELVEPDCVVHRAGFADLVAARGGALPQDGTFRERFEAGWGPMSRVLRDQRARVQDITAADGTVWVRTRMTFVHGGEFLGAPATGRAVEFEEFGVLRLNGAGRVTDAWFLCEELGVAGQLGFALVPPPQD